VSAESRLARRQMRRRHPLPAHGTRARYQLGCHCTVCASANAAYERAWERGIRGDRVLVSAKQARRRIRQMLVEGFTLKLIAAEIGMRKLRQPGAFVTLARHRQIEALYQRRVAE
jgi:hypothetical protein